MTRFFFLINQRWRGSEEIEKKGYSFLANVLKNDKPQAGECVSFIFSQFFTGGWAAQVVSPKQPLCMFIITKKG